MSFGTEHYNKIAEVFRKVNPKSDILATEKQAWIGRLSKMFKEDNPKFNSVLFTEACYDEP